jgi:hypothetical protein
VSEQLDAAQLFAEVGSDPSLDLLMRKDPREVSDAELEQIIRVRRQERAFLIKAKE